jgi:competence ComEA-like helix-hairpin-helix protein
MVLLLFFLIVQEFEAQGESESLIEEIEKLRHNPIPINIATKNELTKIYWISPQFASTIIKTRKKIGSFRNAEDLRKVPGMTDEILNKICPYITFTSLKKSAHKPNVQFKIRTRVQEKFPREVNKKLGSPQKVYHRINFKYKNINSILLIEKDAYEPDYTDFITGGIMIYPVHYKLHKILIGDYRLEFGEALLFGFPPVITFKNQGIIKKRERGVKLYPLSGENTFLRGICGELRITNYIKNFIFFSNTKVDGKVEDNKVYAYYNYEGDHSTASGIEQKDRVREILFGTRLEYCRNIKFGCTWYKNTHLLTSEENVIGAYNLLGFDFSYSFNFAEFFGEIGRCNENYAGIVGIEYKRNKIRISSLYRYYPPHFYLFHSSPWADRRVATGGLSEKGSYLYIGYTISKNIKLSSYFDIFTRLPKPYSEDFPTQGTEYLSEIMHRITKSLIFTYRYSFGSIGEAQNKRIRVQLDIKSKIVNIRMRTEKVYETVGEESYLGELMYGDIRLRVFDLIFSMRLILFNSQLRNFGLYEYEQDLPGVMKNQFLSGDGTRFYLLVKKLVTSYLKVSMKYEITSKKDALYSPKYGIQVDLKLQK